LSAAHQREELVFADCEKCMQTQSKTSRQFWGCAYEAPVEGAVMWEPPSSKHGFRQNEKLEPLPTVCPGYSTSLPEVLEIRRAHRHWSNGSLTAFAKEPSEGLLIGIEVYDAEINSVQHYEMTPESEGGGRK
jgi:hypothetical protein